MTTTTIHAGNHAGESTVGSLLAATGAALHTIALAFARGQRKRARKAIRNIENGVDAW